MTCPSPRGPALRGLVHVCLSSPPSVAVDRVLVASCVCGIKSAPIPTSLELSGGFSAFLREDSAPHAGPTRSRLGALGDFQIVHEDWVDGTAERVLCPGRASSPGIGDRRG